MSWFVIATALRLESLGAIITFAAALLAVIFRDTSSPGLIGLSISYALQVLVQFLFPHIFSI